MAKIYDVQISNPPGVPAALEVHLRVKRRDGKALSRRELHAFGERWRPWRSVATWYLWRSLDPLPVEY